jgi:hypothetical protein
MLVTVVLLSFLFVYLTMNVVINTSATPRMDLLGPILQDGFDKKSWVADRVFPVFLVNKMAGAIPTWMLTDAQILQIRHGRGSAFARIQSTVQTVGYTCYENGIEEGLTVQDYDIITRDQAEIQLSRRLSNVVLRQRESTLANALMGATGETLFTGQVTIGAATWGTTNADPIGDIATAKSLILQRIGKPANKIVMSYGAYTKLIKTPEIQTAVRAVLGYSGDFAMVAIAMETDPTMLCKVFGVDEVIVSWGTYNTKNEGQTAIYANVWPDTYCLVFRGAPNTSVLNEDVCLGRMFMYDQANQMNLLASGQVDSMKGLIFETYPEPQSNSDVFRAREFISQTITSLAAAQLIKSI